APCRVSFTSCASANRCTEISFFSRSTSCSGIRAISTAFRKKPVKQFFQFFAFSIPFASIHAIRVYLQRIQGEQKNGPYNYPCHASQEAFAKRLRSTPRCSQTS